MLPLLYVEEFQFFKTALLKGTPLCHQELPAGHHLLHPSHPHPHPAPRASLCCAKPVFSLGHVASHRHSRGCNMNLINHLQDSLQHQ